MKTFLIIRMFQKLEERLNILRYGKYKKEPNQTFRHETYNAWHENMLDGTKADKTLQKRLVNLKTQKWKLSKREIPRGKNDRKPDDDISDKMFLKEGGGLRKNIWKINGRKMSRLGETYKPTGLSSTSPVCRKPYVEETVPRHIIQFVKTVEEMWRKLYQDISSNCSKPVKEEIKAFREKTCTEEQW